MKRRKRTQNTARSILTGLFAVFLFFLFYIGINKNISPLLLVVSEVFPTYGENISAAANLYTYREIGQEKEQIFIDTNIAKNNENETVPGEIYLQNNEQEHEEVIKQNKEQQIIGINNVIYQPGTDTSINNNSQTDILTGADVEKLKDFGYLKNTFYTVDKRTELLKSDIDVDAFLNKDFRLDRSETGPKILIIHTHSQEAFMDSKKGDLNDGIFSVGEKLAYTLKTKYNIDTLHDKGSYDIVNGRSSTLGAYERMEVSVSKILEKNPTIEMVIDVHRDGVANENIKFVTNVDGKETAKIMFFNGLCRVYKNGVLSKTEGLHNPYVEDNLALSFNLQLLANELYPGFTRKLYVNAYRYSLHFKAKPLLIEVGVQTNTKEEALNSVEPLAEMLAKIL